MEIVKIGNQEWSTINLDTDKFNNGDPIPEIQNMDEWNEASKNKQPAYCYYDNNSENGVLYGKLYNWYAVTDPRGLAPNGFRIPTKRDIEELIINLTGGIQRSSEMIREKRVAGKDLKKNISDWAVPSISKAKLKELIKFEKNEIELVNIIELKIGQGFNALPGGERMAAGFRDFVQIANLATFWTSTPNDYIYSDEQLAFGIESEAYGFFLDYFSGINIPKSGAKEGKSIRFVRNI